MIVLDPVEMELNLKLASPHPALVSILGLDEPLAPLGLALERLDLVELAISWPLSQHALNLKSSTCRPIVSHSAIGEPSA